MPVDDSLQRFTSPDFRRIVSKAVEFFDNTPIHSLPPEESFEGVGVYGIYYSGNYSIYSALADPSYKQPIYVGKAVPAGWRTSRATATGRNLYSRLRQHAASIQYVGGQSADADK